MVHDLELSVGGQVYLGKTRTLTTSLQRCNEDREISLPGLIRLSMYKIVTSYLVAMTGPACPLDETCH
jgi:hypothetical protein